MSQLIPLIFIAIVFYLLILRPQQKRQKELRELIANLKTGDRIITTGGVIGNVTALRETSLMIRSAEKSILEISRTAVAGIQGEEEKK